MKTNYLLGVMCSILVAGLQTSALSQDDNKTSKQLMKEDSAAVNALVMYPDTIRLDIFEACEYPAAIVSIASLQQNSRDEFVSLISGYSKSEQEDFWNLSRYPGLIMRLAEGGRKSEDQINGILTDYPDEIHDTALKYGMGYYDLLQKMDDIQTRTDDQFEKILADYPTVTQQALRELVQFPEVINLLNDHLSLTVRVGDHYRRNPQGVIHRADSLNLAESIQNAQNVESWKDSIQNNPDEENDLSEAADDYAKENGYTQDEIDAAPNPDYISNYTCYPYPYWFGYPTWYPYSYWYPYPFWFDCGFYHDRSGRIIIIGTPSRYFTDWYFYYPEHWEHHPHLADAYINHYYGRRRSPGANSGIVHRWVHDNKNYLPKDFVSNRPKRTQVIRQLAQLNIDAQRQRGGKSVPPAERDQYFQNNKSKYPSLNDARKPALIDKQDNIPDVAIPRPERQPPVRIDREVEGPRVNPQRPPSPPVSNPDVHPQPANQPSIRMVRPAARVDATPKEATPRPAYNFNQINKAQEYQRSVWEQTQPTARPQPQPAPRPQTQQPARQAPTIRGGRSKDK